MVALRNKKVLIYSHDTFGLGNIRRMLSIAKYLVDSDDELSALVLSGSPMLHAFRIPVGMDYIKLPCLTRTLTGDYAVKYLGLPHEDMIRLRANVILSTVNDYNPDLILVDKKPYGVENELLPTLELLQHRWPDTRLVLLLRDILDSPSTTTAIWEKNGYHEAIRDLYDSVLVVGSPEIFDVAEEYCFPSFNAKKTRFCGYIRRESGRRSRQEVREGLGVGKQRLVMVAAGGGYDGHELLTTYIKGLRRMPLMEDTKTLMIYGPEMTAEYRRQILDLSADDPNILVIEFVDDMMSYMDAADLIVSMGGYNTVCELLTLGKKAVIVPRIEPVQEQWIRASRMAELGLLRTIHPNELTPKRLIDAVSEELAEEIAPSKRLYQADLNALPRIGGYIASLLAEKTQYIAEPLFQGTQG